MNSEQNTLTSKKAAYYLGISEAALRLWRSRGEGPRHFKAGEKLIRYRRTDLDSWIELRLSQPANEKAADSRSAAKQEVRDGHATTQG